MARKTNRLFVPTVGETSWQGLLADPELHWREGYSAHSLAVAWESAEGLPISIGEPFKAFGFREVTLLFGLPEWTTDLPDGLRGSQSDLFALLRADDMTIATTVEGKVKEPFGPTVGEWLSNKSPARPKRLDHLAGLLGLDQPVPHPLRYQLFHRTASAVIEAKKFKTDYAAMIVHSFAEERDWFDDFAAFASVLGVPNVEPSTLYEVKTPSTVPLLIGWVSDPLPSPL